MQDTALCDLLCSSALIGMVVGDMPEASSPNWPLPRTYKGGETSPLSGLCQRTPLFYAALNTHSQTHAEEAPVFEWRLLDMFCLAGDKNAGCLQHGRSC